MPQNDPPYNFNFIIHYDGQIENSTDSIGNLGLYPVLTGTGQSLTHGCPFGHSADGNYVEYYDGIVTSRCIGCGDRIIIPRVPGGISLLHIKTLLGMVMGANEESELSHILGEFAQLRRDLEEEQFSVEEAHRLMGLLETLIKQKVNKDT